MMYHNFTAVYSNITSPPAFNPADFGMLAFLQAHIHTKQLLVAFLTWVIYEMIITFDQSVELFWNRKWTLSKALFITNRYNVVFIMTWFTAQTHWVSPPLSYCKASLWIGLLAAVIGISVLNLVLLVRVHALWSNSRMAVGVAVLLSLINLIMFTSILSYTYAKNIVVVGVRPFTGCLILPTFNQVWLILIGSLVFETYATTLILVKCVPIALKQRPRSQLSFVLVTDGLIYYITIVALHLFDIVVTLGGPISLSIPVITSYPVTALVGVACNRLLIRLQSGSLMPELDLDTYSEDS